MSEKIIDIKDLGKSYLISHKAQARGSYIALRDVISESVSSAGKKIFKGDNGALPRREEFWALKDVTFGVERGERIGIIGRNGSGKTTLLKLLSRITEPTTGTIELRGRTASLLEIGTGFHPELTGRENIYLNGAVLGMTRKEINRKFDEIVAFSEVEKFLDTPVKRYSSGMYLRLAFSVAAHLDTDIMLIDEVLAVGDAAFQRKCLGKMEEEAGTSRTVLFVSHNMTAVKQICDKVIWVDKGRVADIGEPGKVINNYLASAEVSVFERKWEDADAPGNDAVKIISVRVKPDSADESVITTDDPAEIEFVFRNNLDEGEINLSFILWTLSGECVFNTASEVKRVGKGVYKGVCRIPANLLNSNVYSIEIMVIKDRSYAVYKQKDILSFEVLDGDRVEGWYGKWVGAVRPKLDFVLEEVR
ncbi:MAG: ABC transporter ATP-binding protein [Ignavibacteriae bacterium]|nr:ABC transporter ATP-binding protein [Ignavibacteriota bacterium]